MDHSMEMNRLLTYIQNNLHEIESMESSIKALSEDKRRMIRKYQEFLQQIKQRIHG